MSFGLKPALSQTQITLALFLERHGLIGLSQHSLAPSAIYVLTVKPASVAPWGVLWENKDMVKRTLTEFLHVCSFKPLLIELLC